MGRSPIASRHSFAQTSPGQRFSADFLSEDRNSEMSHQEALAAAKAEHDRVREAAIRVFELSALEEERKKIELEQKQQEERLRKQREFAAEQERLRELKAKTVPKPAPPPPEPEPTRSDDTQQAQKATTPRPEPQVPSKTPSPVLHRTNVPSPSPALNGVPAGKATTPSHFSQPSKAQPSPFAQQSPLQTTTPRPNGPDSASPEVQPKPTPPQPPVARPDPYIQIHAALKRLRKNLIEESSKPGHPLKGKVGEIKREIRKSMGQLTGAKGANAMQLQKVKALLRQSLDGTTPSPMVDAATFVVDKREPRPNARHNGAELPVLFIYLLNIISKAMINQFATECRASPKAADPVGVVAAQIFSDPDYQWRGKSLIDILLAKFRKECPVVFGVRGSDKTAEGRIAIGWRHQRGGFMSEQMHNDRMAGLGAGFASISLRDFSKANKENPYPPSHYWKALASIVNTPEDQVSNTQYNVLAAMIDGHEQRFLQFYGNAGLAALRVALVEFPKKSPKSPAAGILRVLGETMQKERGLDLG